MMIETTETSKKSRWLQRVIRVFAIGILCLMNYVLVQVYTEVSVRPSQTPLTVTLTQEGFSPKIVTLAPGGTITFVTTRPVPFWPASDLHPSHGIYAAFDPKEPLAPNNSWSFTFDTEGVWGFHDHLSPEYKGVIRVARQTRLSSTTWGGKMLMLVRKIFPAERNPDALLAACDAYKSARGAYQECWKKTFETLLASGTIDEALDILGQLKAKNIDFSSDCHVYAHIIGEEAYWRFRGQPKFAINSDTGNCSFGFYHGFMQEFASHEQTFERAVAFCRVVRESLTKTSADQINVNVYGSNCEHGIGHGLAYKYIIPNWGDELKVVSLSVADCRSISGINTMECINGVFGGIAAMYFGLHGYNVAMNMEDPFWLCHDRPVEEQSYCYDSMIPPLYQVTGSDFTRTVQYITKIPTTAGREVAMRHLGAMKAHEALRTNEFTEVITACRALNTELHLGCIAGFSSQILHIGIASDAFVRAQAFCTALRPGAERVACYVGLSDTLDYLLSPEEKLKYCDKMEPIYAESCRKPR